MWSDLPAAEVCKIIFPLLDGKDLSSCMCVCKQWKDIATDDYLWKCLCANKWPSMCRSHSSPMVTFHKLYRTFSKHHHPRTLLPPRLSFDDLEFYIDLWINEKPLLSQVISGPSLQMGIKSLPTGVSDVLRVLRYHLDGTIYKMMIPVHPRTIIPVSQNAHVSLFVSRKDTNKIACIVNRGMFDYVDATYYRALAFDYLNFSPVHPIVPDIRAWVSLLFMEGGNESIMDIFAIVVDFCHAATSEEEALWLLEMLDWK